VVKNGKTLPDGPIDNSDKSNVGDSQILKLPPYTELKADGYYRYRRRVPVKAVGVVSKGYLYRNLGKTVEGVLKNYSRAHEEIEALLKQAKTDTMKEELVFAQKDEREKVLHLVQKHYGQEASEMLAAGAVDDNFELALMGLADELEGTIPANTRALLYSGKVPDKVITMTHLLDLYRESTTVGDVAKDKKTDNQIERIKADFAESLGAVKASKLPFQIITRKDANTYRDFLLALISPNSVMRYKNTLNASINWYIKENGLDHISAFTNLLVKGSGHTKNDRLPLSQDDVSLLNKKFAGQTTEAIFTILRDTGARVGEVAGLLVSDISLQNKTLHIKPNAIRTLKNLGSERVVPLSDSLLSVLQVQRVGKEDNQPIFDAYARAGGNTALSAILMKHLRVVVKEPRKSIHSLRHKMKDDLRNSGCDSSLADAVLGHTTAGVGSRYGSGYNAETMREALAKTW
jgi:integrase